MRLHCTGLTLLSWKGSHHSHWPLVLYRQVCSPVWRVLWGCSGERRTKDGHAAGQSSQRDSGEPQTRSSGFSCCWEFCRESQPAGGNATRAPLSSTNTSVQTYQAGDQLLQQPGRDEYQDRISPCKGWRGRGPRARSHDERSRFRRGGGCAGKDQGGDGESAEVFEAKTLTCRYDIDLTISHPCVCH